MSTAAHNTTEAAVTAAARFDAKAPVYRSHASVQRDMAAWLSQWLPPQDTAGTDAAQPNSDTAHVLDLGAGDGTFTRHLAAHFQNITALDSAENMLTEGQRNVPQAQWLHADAWTLQPLGADALGRITLVTSASLLQWCRNPQQMLCNWAARLQPGTRMLHGFYVEPTLQEWRTLFGNGSQLDWLQPAQWQEAFAQAGWQVIRSECEVRRYCFSSALELARSLHGTGAIANAGQLGSGRFRSLLRAYDAQYRSRNLPPTDPLYNFGDAVTHDGVFASWAFFRIEAVLR